MGRKIQWIPQIEPFLTEWFNHGEEIKGTIREIYCYSNGRHVLSFRNIGTLIESVPKIVINLRRMNTPLVRYFILHKKVTNERGSGSM